MQETNTARGEEGAILLDRLEKASIKLLPTLPEPGKESLTREIQSYRDALESYKNNMAHIEKNALTLVQQWEKCNADHTRLCTWLKDKSSEMKNIPLRSTSQEKEEQLKIVKVCVLYS